MEVDDEKLTDSSVLERLSKETVLQQSSYALLDGSISNVRSIATTLVREDAVLFFTKNSQRAQTCWLSLCKETFLLPTTNPHDPAIAASF